MELLYCCYQYLLPAQDVFALYIPLYNKAFNWSYVYKRLNAILSDALFDDLTYTGGAGLYWDIGML